MLKLKRGNLAALSGTLATMGPGVPYAIAAKFAHPERPVIALVGDGAMQMNGLNELITVAKYWQRWSNPQLVVLVLNNRDLNQVTWEQRALQGDPKYPVTQEIPDFPYARFAELVGLKGIRVDDPDQVADAWDEALAAKAAGAAEPLTKGSVVASDAFFPFADGLLAAAEAGATAVIQPGGSLRDDEVIAAADEHGVALVFTGERHFRH